MVDDDVIEIELLPEERGLIIEYGYPFPDAHAQLEAVASSPDVEILTISSFYLNQLIGDLCYSINKRTKGRIQRALLELCERLEFALRTGDGDLDVW
jgi:hypothetical protein